MVELFLNLRYCEYEVMLLASALFLIKLFEIICIT